ncbi:MAG: hypothetical protein EOP86_02760 [Verrucomicrobiaceae bacterium]|nr:MAG: hypothetical protein EOP86_02760 [Verrucomicrobiaceae bacterium]
MLPATVAGLMVLFWCFGHWLGQTWTHARSHSGAVGGLPFPAGTESGPALESTAVTDAVTPASTAALLESTLLNLRKLPRGRGFLARLAEARLITDLARLGTPRLLALVDALLEEGGSDAEEMAGRLLGPVLLARDPAGVWLWLRDGAGTGGETRLRFLSGTGAVFGAWAARDPAAALAAWDREAMPLVRSGKLDGAGFAAIFRSWGASRPEAALEAARQISDPAMRASAVEGLAASLGKMFENEPSSWPPDAAELINRVLAFSGDKASAGLTNLVKGRLRYEEPREVAAWADRLEMSPEQKTILSKAVADQWMTKDPPAAADWYLSRFLEEDSNAKAQALERIIRKWTRVDDNSRIRGNTFAPDPAAASDWLNAQGIGPASQDAMTALARAWGQAREPEAAVAWARALPDEAARARAMEAVTEEIRQRFPNDWTRFVQP